MCRTDELPRSLEHSLVRLHADYLLKVGYQGEGQLSGATPQIKRPSCTVKVVTTHQELKKLLWIMWPVPCIIGCGTFKKRRAVWRPGVVHILSDPSPIDRQRRR